MRDLTQEFRNRTTLIRGLSDEKGQPIDAHIQLLIHTYRQLRSATRRRFKRFSHGADISFDESNEFDLVSKIYSNLPINERVEHDTENKLYQIVLVVLVVGGKRFLKLDLVSTLNK